MGHRYYRFIWLPVLVLAIASLACEYLEFGSTSEEPTEAVTEVFFPTITPTATATEAPTVTPSITPTEVKPLAAFEDMLLDAVVCGTNNVVENPAVDILKTEVWKAPDGFYVDVTMGERVDVTLDTVYSFALNIITYSAADPSTTRGFSIMIHDGQRSRGEFTRDGGGTFISSTEYFAELNAETGMPRFMLPADTTEFFIEAFLKATSAQSDAMHCDTAADEAERYLIPFG